MQFLTPLARYLAHISPFAPRQAAFDKVLINDAQNKKRSQAVILEAKEEAMTYLPKATREITLIVVHCTANSPWTDIGVKEIDRDHKNRGWSGIGYHGVIRKNGTFERGRNINTSGAHARGYNRGSIGISLVGGLGSDGRPAPDYKRAQWSTLKAIIAELQQQYPGVKITGHNTLGPKACPSFKVEEWMETGEVIPVR